MPTKSSQKITPKQALANTRKLLKEKKAQARRPAPWRALEDRHAPAGEPGFQSDSAQATAESRHAGESRMAAIEGSISTRDRQNQGKRDKN